MAHGHMLYTWSLPEYTERFITDIEEFFDDDQLVRHVKKLYDYCDLTVQRMDGEGSYTGTPILTDTPKGCRSPQPCVKDGDELVPLKKWLAVTKVRAEFKSL